MSALIGFLLLAQAWLPGSISWLEPGNYDTTTLLTGGVNYEVAFGAGCDDFAPPMDVQILAGSGGVALLTDTDGNGDCNVLIGAPIE